MDFKTCLKITFWTFWIHTFLCELLKGVPGHPISLFSPVIFTPLPSLLPLRVNSNNNNK